MQPLCSNVQFDAIAAQIRECHRCFETQEGLILHADRVIAFNRDVACDEWVTVENVLMADQIAIWMNLFCSDKHC